MQLLGQTQFKQTLISLYYLLYAPLISTGIHPYQLDLIFKKKKFKNSPFMHPFTVISSMEPWT